MVLVGFFNSTTIVVRIIITYSNPQTDAEKCFEDGSSMIFSAYVQVFHFYVYFGVGMNQVV